MSKERKRLNTVLGYYSFGQDYTNLAASDDRSRYVSVHEYEHAMLGTSSYFGMFPQFLAYLSSSTQPRAGEIGRELFAKSIEAVIDVHEATATYCEFTYARFNNFEKVDDMERDLPPEYRRWRGFYDGVFEECLPLDIQAKLASLLSRHAMNTSILVDYATPSFSKFQNFETYLKEPENSPNERFYRLLEFVNGEDQERIFQNFLACYRRHSEELHSLYDDRTARNRKRSFQIHGELYWAFARDRATMLHPDGITHKENSFSLT